MLPPDVVMTVSMMMESVYLELEPNRIDQLESAVVRELIREKPDGEQLFSFLSMLAAMPCWLTKDTNITKSELWRYRFFAAPPNVIKAALIIRPDCPFDYLLELHERKLVNLGACITTLLEDLYTDPDGKHTYFDLPSGNILHLIAKYAGLAQYIDIETHTKHPQRFINAAMIMQDANGETPFNIATAQENLPFIFVLIKIACELVRCPDSIIIHLTRSLLHIYAMRPDTSAQNDIRQIFKYLSASSLFTTGKKIYDELYLLFKDKLPDIPLWKGWQYVEDAKAYVAAWVPAFIIASTAAAGQEKISPFPPGVPSPSLSEFDAPEDILRGPTPC